MSSLSRRSALRKVSAGAAAWAAFSSLGPNAQAAESSGSPARKGRINHSVCKWCYDRIPLDEFCKAAKEMGISSVELLEPGDFPVLKKHGLVCAMVSGVPGGIGSGLNRVENHDKIVEFFERMLPIAANAGQPNVICFSGNRAGMNDEKGIENCVTGLKRIAPAAERHKVTVIMELLNSKVDHKDYMCDHTAWGAEVCKRVGSERVKLLYDIYHMQIMEGDVIRTIKENIQYIGHFHTGGVPGRNEIDDTQELNYPEIMRTIAATGYKGYVAQEFIPKSGNPLASLRRAIDLCDV
jgi:hydroxypyruvate isomerase